MSYEVVKTVRGREYRYLVESYRDAQTGKVRNKWRYLGKGLGEQPPRRRTRAEAMRANLIRALQALLERRPWSAITMREVAAQAGVAPATVYRYFSSCDDLLRAAAAEANDRLEARLAELHRLRSDREGERVRLRAWFAALLEEVPRQATPIALIGDRHPRRQRAFERYFELLAAHGYRTIAHGERPALALALSQIVSARVPLRDDECSALATTVERLIFD